ncbi:hypothetical protein ATB53_13055 [Xanthomonas translucens]|uniref:Uncharacterized protein n=1 Tax=Xanthomonas campestris pv. translucens TaxID=343 RepID=A0A109HMB3_XANCT|nr:hypothetical protein ATB53_13055 [Xanthomonas translucens]
MRHTAETATARLTQCNSATHWFYDKNKQSEQRPWRLQTALSIEGLLKQFNGRNCERQGQLQEGEGKAVEQDVVASYAKSQELGAMANAKAAEFALGKAPAPQDPFNLPAKADDRTGLDNQNWHRNPNTESWERQVKTGVTGANDQGVYAPQTAPPEQTQRLNQEALARIQQKVWSG